MPYAGVAGNDFADIGSSARGSVALDAPVTLNAAVTLNAPVALDTPVAGVKTVRADGTVLSTSAVGRGIC